MGLDTEDLKRQINEVIDRWVDNTVVAPAVEEAEAERELPKDKRVVRTKSSGDRVYLLDEVKKTREHVKGPEELDKTGFIMADVQVIEDTELLGYQMLPTTPFRPPNA